MKVQVPVIDEDKETMVETNEELPLNNEMIMEANN